MNILFIHQNFPGQFRHLAPALARLEHQVCALTMNELRLPGVRTIQYRPKQATSKTIFPLATDFETKLIRAEACAQAMKELRNSGFVPDLVIAHPGWGETLFLKDIFPQAKQLHFLEFYYSNLGGDVGFDTEFENRQEDDAFRVTVKNAHVLMGLNEMDRAYAPTQWQKSRFPNAYHSKIEVIFDGIDTAKLLPAEKSKRTQIRLTNSAGQEKILSTKDQCITFVNRNLEPYRGYHSLMRSLPQILHENPHTLVLIVGGDGTSYGAKPPKGKTWKQIFIEELGGKLDLTRVFFLGNLPYDQYVQVLKLSACHVYLTYPFVLSWSCLEAMSLGCVVVGSDTAPVTEVIEHGHNGLIVDFFDYEKIASQVGQVLRHPEAFVQMRQNARQTIIDHYDLQTVCLPRQLALVNEMLGSKNQ